MPNDRDASPKRPKTARDTMSTGWVYTFNNYGTADVRNIKALSAVRGNKVRYSVFGYEVSKTGTPHLQGYIHFETRKRFSTIKNLIGDTIHLEPLAGTPQQASDYCKKDGNFWENGTLPEDVGQGTRNDLIDIKTRIDGGASADDIGSVPEHFGNYVRYNRGFRSYENTLVRPRNFKSQVCVFYGEPGTYKSFSANRYKDSYEVVRPTGKNQPVWFDGYNPRNHVCVSFDDFYGWMPFHSLLQICDRYGCRVQVKGDTKQFRPAFVVFTSNVHPERWYKYDEHMQYSAIERRINFVARHFRADADADGKYRAGDLLIRVERGNPAWHPLWEFMMPVVESDEAPEPDGLYKLDVSSFYNDAIDTQPADDELLEIHRGAQLPGFGPAPVPQAASPTDAQPPITDSQLAFIDLVEDYAESDNDSPGDERMVMDSEAEEIDSSDSDDGYGRYRRGRSDSFDV